jgi:hypothetical protein
MQFRSVRVVFTLGMVVICLGAISSIRFVAAEVSHLRSRLQSPLELPTDVHTTLWVNTVLSLEASCQLSQSAIQEVLGTRYSSIVAGVSVAAP